MTVCLQQMFPALNAFSSVTGRKKKNIFLYDQEIVWNCRLWDSLLAYALTHTLYILMTLWKRCEGTVLKLSERRKNQVSLTLKESLALKSGNGHRKKRVKMYVSVWIVPGIYIGGKSRWRSYYEISSLSRMNLKLQPVVWGCAKQTMWSVFFYQQSNSTFTHKPGVWRGKLLNTHTTS